MTKKHFEAIARIFADRANFNHSTIGFDNGHNHAHEGLAHDLADFFEEENPNFDRKRFLTACGLMV